MAENKPPRTGGKAGDRISVKVNRADHSKGGKSGVARGNQPKYDDTDEAKKQKKLIRDIENEISQVQNDLKKLDRVKVVKRTQPRVRLEDKSSIENQIKDLESRIAQKEEELRNLQPNIKKLQETANEKRAALNKLKTSVFFTNGAAKDFIESNERKLQEEIKRLEAKLETESLSIAEEKVVVKDVKRIKAMRANFAPYQKRYNESRIAGDKLQDQLKEANFKQKKIDEWKAEILSLKGDLSSVDEKEKEVKKAVEEEKKKQETVEQKEKDEKQKLIEKIDSLAQKLRQEKENLRIKRDNWYESKRQLRNKKIEEQNQERQEKRKEIEATEKEKITQRRLDKKLEIPFEYEMGVCQSLISYLTELLSATKSTDTKEEKKEEGKKEEPKKEEPKKEEKKEEGYIKGKDEPEDLLFPDLAGQKKKTNKKKKKKAPAKMTHNWDTFTRFEELGLGDPPITSEQIPKAIESVRVKLADLQKQSAAKRAEILKEIQKEEEEEKKAEAQRKKQAAESGDSKEEPKKEENKQAAETKTDK